MPTISPGLDPWRRRRPHLGTDVAPLAPAWYPRAVAGAEVAGSPASPAVPTLHRDPTSPSTRTSTSESTAPPRPDTTRPILSALLLIGPRPL